MNRSLPHDAQINDVPSMELHLERLRRDRLRRSMSGGQNQQRRSSRFSTVSSTATFVEPRSTQTTAQPTPAAPERPHRPSVEEVVKKHPRNVLYLSILMIIFIGGIVGWAIYLNRPGRDPQQDGFRGGFVVNGLLIVA